MDATLYSRSSRFDRSGKGADSYTFCRTFDTEFDDFFITRIARSEETSTEFWGILLNFVFTPVGGCQQEVKLGDKVLWAFNAFNVAHFLSLDGPVAAIAGRPATFTVTDGGSGVVIANATVASPGGPSGVTDAEGKVSLTFRTAGLHTLKAERADSIRSNAVTVFVA